MTHDIVVLGAGYAGLMTAVSLAGRTKGRAGVRITLVNPGERFTERLRLHEVAAGHRVAELRLPRVLAGTGVELVCGWVTGIDPAAHSVRIDDERVLAYDVLVYALGSVAGSVVSGSVVDDPAAAGAYTLDSAQDAVLLVAVVRPDVPDAGHGRARLAPRRPVDPMTDIAFGTHRGLLFSLAYRILGTAADAEDAVQDTWLKWSAADRSRVADPRAYLVRIVSNLAVDRLRSARARRETYVGPWLPEPILTGADAGAATAEGVSMALLVVLESLSPLERAVFVPNEAFGFPYAEIAAAVGRSEETVRQAAHRARGHVQSRRPRFPADAARHREVTERFFAAAMGADLNTLMELLAPDVTLWTDGGGKVRQALRPVVGAERVASWFAAIGSQPYQGMTPAEMTARLTELNGGPGIVFTGGGRVIATVSIDLDESGRITTIHNVANPDKLRAVATNTVHRL
jgi:RNA polymerase sigma-70 factor (ECF subfamily)